jgi:hypothetical protein
VEPFVETDMSEARLAQRHERALLDPAAEVSGLGVPHDLTWVADGLEIAGDEFVERRSFRAGNLDDAVSRRGGTHGIVMAAARRLDPAGATLLQTALEPVARSAWPDVAWRSAT